MTMSRSAAFKAKLETYGTLVDLMMLPTDKCSCWKYGYPDKDCTLCGGEGYAAPGPAVSVKAFIFPSTGSSKEFTNEVGTAKMGQCVAYFSPDLDLYQYEKVVWDEVTYRISQRDRAVIGSEIIYRECQLDRAD